MGVVKRYVSLLAALLVVLGTGFAGAGCDLAPMAVSVDGSVISASALNSEISAYQSSPVGQCFLQLTNSSALAGGLSTSGHTASTGLTSAVLENQVYQLLTEKFAAERGIVISASAVNLTVPDVESILGGDISALARESQARGTRDACMAPNGSSFTGRQVLAELPGSLRHAEVLSQAINERLLAQGATISPEVERRYYLANEPLFTSVCVSAILVGSKATANALIHQISAGASFAAVAKANSLDPGSAPSGGALGCDYTLATLKQALGLASIPVNTPIGPVQDQHGDWDIYEVTGETLEPFAQARPVVFKELLQSSANIDRVGRAESVFARHANVFVNPVYGSWRAVQVERPTPPPVAALVPDSAAKSPAPGMTSRSVPAGATATSRSSG